MKKYLLVPLFVYIIFIVLKRKINKLVGSFNADIFQKMLEVITIVTYTNINYKLGALSLISIILCNHFLNNNFEGFQDENEYMFKDDDNKIPKLIIQTWKTKDIPQKYQPLVDSVKKINYNYEYMYFTDDDIEKFLTENYPEYYDTYEKLPVKIQKIDFFRYVAVYHYGGFYFDLDMSAIEPLDELLKYDCVLPIDEIINEKMCNINRYKNFCDKKINYLIGQYAFAASPKNDFIKELVDSIHNNIDKIVKNYIPNSEDYVYVTTGPDFVSNVYINYHDKSNIHVLHYNKRQYFGKYAKHNFFGTWK